jgi:hypothetical protein
MNFHTLQLSHLNFHTLQLSLLNFLRYFSTLFSLCTSNDVKFMTPSCSYEADSRSGSQTLIVLVWDPQVWGSVSGFQGVREFGWEEIWNFIVSNL